MFSDLKFLLAVARYFSVCFKRRFIVHKSSYDAVGRPFEKLITLYKQPIMHGYDLAFELNDPSQLQVRSIVFKKYDWDPLHEYLIFEATYEGKNVAHAVIQRIWHPFPRTSPEFGRTRFGSYGMIFMPAYPMNLFPTYDSIHVERDAALVNIQSAGGTKLGTFTTAESALDYSYLKLVIIAAVIQDTVPNSRTFSTDCYYFTALALELAKDPDILGGEFVAAKKSRAGGHAPFKIVGMLEDDLKNDVKTTKEAFFQKWRDILEIRRRQRVVRNAGPAIAKKDERMAKRVELLAKIDELSAERYELLAKIDEESTTRREELVTIREELSTRREELAT